MLTFHRFSVIYMHTSSLYALRAPGCCYSVLVRTFLVLITGISISTCGHPEVQREIKALFTAHYWCGHTGNRIILPVACLSYDIYIPVDRIIASIASM